MTASTRCERRWVELVGKEALGKRYSALSKLAWIMFVIMFPIGVVSVWLGFLLLPIPWWLSWLICVVLLAAGIYIFVLSKREFDRSGQKLTPRAYGTSKLMTSGIYSSIRHPHNLSSVLLNFGIAFVFKSTIGLLVAVASIIVTYWFTLEEEKLLIQQFGDEYREYKARVPMFIPQLARRAY
jgi:protein-S-isoprenylcysteine O-methyltransferase Ste14